MSEFQKDTLIHEMEVERSRLLGELHRSTPPPSSSPLVTSIERAPRQSVGIPQLHMGAMSTVRSTSAGTPLEGLRSEMKITPEAEARLSARVSRGEVDQRLSKLRGLIAEIKK